MEAHPRLFQFIADRFDEVSNIRISFFFRFVEFFSNIIIRIVLKIFERQVFEFTFEFIETEFMCEWRIEIYGLFADFSLQLFILSVPYLPHEVHSVGNHNQYDAHIFRKGQ